MHKVLYAHVPREPDELELVVGDYVYVSRDSLQRTSFPRFVPYVAARLSKPRKSTGESGSGCCRRSCSSVRPERLRR